MNMADTAATAALRQLMSGDNTGGCRGLVPRPMQLSSTVRSVYDAVHAEDTADRQVSARLARATATASPTRAPTGSIR